MTIFYVLAAILWAVIYTKTGMWVASDAMFFGHSVFHVALAIHIAAWILQFIGHGVFEGRAPALLDSWDQAFITAPLFVLMEFSFFFGYKKDFHARCMVQVEKNIAEFKKAKSK